MEKLSFILLFGILVWGHNARSEEADVPVNADDQTIRLEIDVPQHVTDKLGPEELNKLLRSAMHRRSNNAFNDLEDILVPAIVFTALVLIVFITLYLPFRKYKELQETVRQMSQQKLEIPEAILTALQAPRVPTAWSDLRKGLLLSALGIGTSVIILFVNPDVIEDGTWGVGLLPLAIGGAYTLLWYIGRDKEMDT